MRHLMILAAICGLSACTGSGDAPFSDAIEPVETARVQVSRGFGPPGADPRACYGREVDPAVIETVTDQVMVEPEQLASDGSVRRPAVFITETQQRIVEDRRETWFETPCAIEGDVEFITALQRALEVRGLYSGPITGQMDGRTLSAIRAYQQPQGLDSAVLSLAAARQLGLSIWDPELAAGGPEGG